MSLPEDDGFMCGQCDWNEIKVLWIVMKLNDYDWKIDPCVVYMNDVISIEILFENI